MLCTASERSPCSSAFCAVIRNVISAKPEPALGQEQELEPEPERCRFVSAQSQLGGPMAKRIKRLQGVGEAAAAAAESDRDRARVLLKRHLSRAGQGRAGFNLIKWRAYQMASGNWQLAKRRLATAGQQVIRRQVSATATTTTTLSLAVHQILM